MDPVVNSTITEQEIIRRILELPPERWRAAGVSFKDTPSNNDNQTLVELDGADAKFGYSFRYTIDNIAGTRKFDKLIIDNNNVNNLKQIAEFSGENLDSVLSKIIEGIIASKGKTEFDDLIIPKITDNE